MGKMYDWLGRRRKESERGYENRINQCPPQHAGYIFFDRINYDAVRHVFSAYAVWNGEFNAKLQDSLPEGGFEIHCSRQEAEYFCTEVSGVPVFVKLFAKTGRLFSKEIFIRYRDKKFLVNFTGCEVVPIQLVCFRDFSEVPEMYDQEIEIFKGSGFPLRVTRAGEASASGYDSKINQNNNYTGSRKVRFAKNNPSSGMKLAGSARVMQGSGKYLMGTGRYLMGTAWKMGGSGRYLMGTGYQLSGSRQIGSGMSLLSSRNGSMRITKEMLQMYGSGSFSDLLLDDIWGADYWIEIFGIGYLGYGLNLI